MRYFVYLLRIVVDRATYEPYLPAHFRYLQHLDAAGALVLSGPFADRTGGMIVVRAASDAEARAIAEADPLVASGVDVSLWLTGESSWFALPGRAAEFELPHAAPLPDLIESILAAGRITLCTQCAARREITEKDVIEGVRIAGAQVFVQEALAEDTQALVY